MAISIRPYDTGFAAEVSGIDLTSPLAPADGEPVIAKRYNSAFEDTPLEAELADRKSVV